MFGKKYTQCYNFPPGTKPFNEKDLAATVLGAGGPGLLAAIIGFASGSLGFGAIAMTVAVVSAIVTVADQWLYHRLICLTGTKCAIGTVEDTPTDGGLGNFDNDQYFDLILVPHRREDIADNTNPNISSDANYKAKLDANPKNYVLQDGFMGEELLKVSIPGLGFANKDHEARWLHCEAEGSFWVDMRDYAWVIGVIMGVSTAAAVATAIAIGAAMCALGPILCLLGLLLALIAALIIMAIGAAASAGVTAIIYEAGKGDVEDANVGDVSLGPIHKGDKVIVFGEHVYDGFHDGWGEIHPMLAVMKIDNKEMQNFLTWDPNLTDDTQVPKDNTLLPDLPLDARDLKLSDINMGLNSPKMLARSKFLRERWCKLIREAANPTTHTIQGHEKHRWTVHPDVDGCEDEPKPDPIK
jgi:hypothetical protein